MEVQQRDPGYFKALMAWKDDILQTRPDLKLALDKAGLLADLQEKRPALQHERASKMLRKVAEEAGKEVHPEIKKLRAMQMVEASDILSGQAKQQALAVVAGPSKPTKRRYMPSARVLLPHCSVCGQTTHKRQACPHRALQGEGLEAPQRSAVALAHLRNKKQAAVVSRLKYTQVQLRTAAYEDRASKMTRAPLSRDFLGISRATPEALTLAMLEDGLLDDLTGVPCPRQECQESPTEGFLSSKKALGKLCFNNCRSNNITTKTAYHRCDACRGRQGVHLHNPIFEDFCGKGSLGLNYALLAMWNCVEGVPIAITVRQLNIHEGLCAHYYRRANVIMAAEAHRKQKQLVWGLGSNKTVEVEIDATVICKWKTEEEGQLVYRYYCYIGARQRGSVQHLALMPLGISTSVGEGRVNLETTEAYHAFCKEVFGNKKHNLISMTDGAASYRCRCGICVELFEEHHWVNHSRKPLAEFSRPIPAVVADVVTKETRAGMAGTMTLDKEWGLLKELLPSNLTARSVAEMERCDLLVRAQQFRRMTSIGDRWAAFTEAARRWKEQQRNPCRELCNASLGMADVAHRHDVGAGIEDVGAAGDEGVVRGVLSDNDVRSASLESLMQELDSGEIEKLEQACRAQRKVLEERARQVVAKDACRDSQAFAGVEAAIPALKALLIERFRDLAPACAHAKYTEFVQSQEFDQRLFKEVALQGRLTPGGQSEEALQEWLVLLVDRKEIDLAGMVVNAAIPTGFKRGRGSMRGNNCFISSVVQALTGVSGGGDEHDQLCAQIRQAGTGKLWSGSNFIEASAVTLEFITEQVLGSGHLVLLNLYSSYDGSNVSQIPCGAPGRHTQHQIHVLNPTGVHFDPLWPIASLPACEGSASQGLFK